MQKILSSKINALCGYMKFHGNPLCDFKEWGYMHKNTRISTARRPRLLNMVPN